MSMLSAALSYGECALFIKLHLMDDYQMIS